jgi:hypothetical protein
MSSCVISSIFLWVRNVEYVVDLLPLCRVIFEAQNDPAHFLDLISVLV